MVSLQKMQSLAYSHRFALPLRYTTRMPCNNGAVMPRCHGFPEPANPPALTDDDSNWLPKCWTGGPALVGLDLFLLSHEPDERPLA